MPHTSFGETRVRQSRRTFLHGTAAATGAVLLAPAAALSQQAGATQKRAHRITRLSSDAKPVVGTRFVDLETTLAAVLARSVLADDLDELAVTRTLRVGDDDAIDWCFFPPDSAETNSYHQYISREGSRAAAGSSRRRRFRRAPASSRLNLLPAAEYSRHHRHSHPAASALRHLLHHLLHLAELLEKAIHFADRASRSASNAGAARAIQE